MPKIISLPSIRHHLEFAGKRIEDEEIIVRIPDIASFKHILKLEVAPGFLFLTLKFLLLAASLATLL
jgi:hypothetical protein